MSESHPKPPAVSGTAIAVCITVVVCFALAVCAAILIAVPDGARAGSMVVVILSALGPAIAALAALFGVKQVREHVYDLKNGVMDAKIRAGVAEVLDNNLIDPAIREQLASDRAKRDAAAAEVGR